MLNTFGCWLVLLLTIVLLRESQTTPEPSFKESSHLDNVHFYQIDTKKHIHLVSDKFLSFSIDSSAIAHGFDKPSLKNKALMRLISHIGGGYLRLGGTTADRVMFTGQATERALPDDSLNLDSGLCGNLGIDCPISTRKHPKPMKDVPLSADDWITINEFCEAVGMKLLFDFNVLLRANNSDVWDPTNAKLLLDYSSAKGYDIDWELGNEPNTFKLVFGVQIPPEQLARDFKVLKQILSQYPLYKNSNLMGPSTTNPQLSKKKDYRIEFLRTFLSNGPDVDSISWHYYYSGPNVTLADYLSPALLDNLGNVIDVVIRTVEEAGTPATTPVWIGETGSSYGGGAVNLSDRFASSFLFMNTLGTAASRGISLVVRQSIYRGRYRLVDAENMIPQSDFWLSVLYKKLVGRKVLSIREITEDGQSKGNCTVPLRLFAHCSKVRPYPVIFGMNPNNETIGLSILSNNKGRLYSLSGYPHVDSSQVELNGEVLNLGTDQSLPEFNPISVDLKEPVPVRPYSLFFLVVNNKLTLCD